MRFVSLAVVLLLSACGKTATTDPLAPNAVTTMSGAHEGQSITLRGRVATAPWQHLMSGVQDKQEAYFDLGAGKEQTVIYWKDPPACSGEMVVTGKVIAVRGQSKGPKGAESNIEELHVDVATARCLE
jgi:hypothetical protein